MRLFNIFTECLHVRLKQTYKLNNDNKAFYCLKKNNYLKEIAFTLLCNLFSVCVLPSSHFCFVRQWLNLFKQCVALLVIFDYRFDYSCHWRLICLLGLYSFNFWCWYNVVIVGLIQTLVGGRHDWSDMVWVVMTQWTSIPFQKFI